MIGSYSFILLLLMLNVSESSSNTVHRRGSGETLNVRLQTSLHNSDWTLKAADVDPCRSPAVLTEPQGIIDYPAAGSYRSYRYCRWIIYARDPQSKIDLEFTFINIEQDDPCDDYVQILTLTHKPDASGKHTATDFSGRLCPNQIGQLPKTVYETDSPAVLVVFKSDWLFNARGFRLRYEIKSPRQPATSRPTTAKVTYPTLPSSTIATAPTTASPTRRSTKIPATPTAGTSAESFDASRFACDFESSGCAWINKPRANLRFEITTGSSSVWNNWGKEDHTIGTAAGSYAYLYTNRAKEGHFGALVSPELSPNPNSPRCLTLWYNMLQTTSSLVVTVISRDGNTEEVFRRDGGQGRSWHPGKITLQYGSSYFVEISHKRGVYDVESGVIIDDISISEKPCPSTPQECGRRSFNSDRTQLNIIGGMDSRRNEWPWMVRLRVFKSGIRAGKFSQCGGTLIDPQWVVTAAHCFESGIVPTTDPDNTLISFGEHDTTESSESEFTVRPVKVLIHPDRADALQQRGMRFQLYDIALLKLKRPVTLDSNVNTACFPTSSFPPGTSCYALGWGLDETEKASPILQELRKVVQSKEDCSYRIIDGMTCATGSGISDVCAGDSGGPLVCQRAGKFELAGIVSFGDRCAAKRDTSGVYADVFYFRTWLQQTMNSE